MFPSHAIEQYLEFTPPELADIVRELRNLVAEIAPQATERLHSRGLTYFDAARGGPVSAGICQIAIYPDHVRLALIHGAFLPDPLGLLQSEGERLAKRFVRLTSYEAAPWEALRDLIAASARYDPRAGIAARS